MSFTALSPLCLLETMYLWLRILPTLSSRFPFHNNLSLSLQWKDIFFTHLKLSMVYYPTWKNLRSIKQKEQFKILMSGKCPSTKAFLITWHFLMFNSYLLHLVLHLWLLISIKFITHKWYNFKKLVIKNLNT